MASCNPQTSIFMACSIMEKPLMKNKSSHSQVDFCFGPKECSKLDGVGFCADLVFLFVFALVIIGILERQGFGHSSGFRVVSRVSLHFHLSVQIFAQFHIPRLDGLSLFAISICHLFSLAWRTSAILFLLFFGWSPGSWLGLNGNIAANGYATGAWLPQFALHYVIRQSE